MCLGTRQQALGKEYLIVFKCFYRMPKAESRKQHLKLYFE